jgi:hypothetical protein
LTELVHETTQDPPEKGEGIEDPQVTALPLALMNQPDDIERRG